MSESVTTSLTKTQAALGHATSKDETRHAIGNVHLRDDRIEATNGHIALWTAKPDGLDGEFDGCWNGKAWSKLRGLTTRNGDMLIDEKSHACNSDLGAQYPNIAQVIPSAPADVQLTLSADTLRTLLKSLPEVKGSHGTIRFDIILDSAVKNKLRTISSAIRIHTTDVDGLLMPCRNKP